MSRNLKLKYPFNTAANLEVEYAPTKWCRMTCDKFRCFLGPRRINNEPYEGPVFYERTNFEYTRKENDETRFINVEELNDETKIDRFRLKRVEVLGRRKSHDYA